MERKKRILYIVHHRLNRSPGQRYRLEQYLSYLEGGGFSYTFSPIIVNEKEDFALYRSTNLFDKGFIFLKSIVRRLYDVFRAFRYDYIFIYREAFLTGSVFFERMLRLSGAKIILDFDDAIWLPDISEANKKLSFLKRPEKIMDVIKLSDLVITGNAYLQNFAKPYNKNTVVFPSTIDLDYYKTPDLSTSTKKAVVIGWSGSHTTIKHFETIIPVLKRLKAKYGNEVSFSVYGDPTYVNQELGIEGIPWSSDTEVGVISSFDIGIMPLPNDEWSKGKCAMKGLQYMGLCVPAVLSPVGMNNDVIESGVNGYLASNEDEWLHVLIMLIENKDLRTSIGNTGRKTIEQKFSCQANYRRYLELLQSV